MAFGPVYRTDEKNMTFAGKMIVRLGKGIWHAVLALHADIFLRFLYRRKLIVLFYHGVARDPASQPRNEDGRHVSLEKFRRQMEYISRRYSVLSFSDAMDALDGKRRLPPNPVVITFDDGYRNNLDDMLPLSRALGIPVTVFITTAYAARQKDPSYLGWDDIVTMEKNGVTFGSHTVTHPHLDRLTDAQVSEELIRSKKDIEDTLGDTARFFSYPYGDHDERVCRLVREAGYDAACTVRYGVNDMRTDRYRLHRIAVNDNYSFEYFVAALFPCLFFGVRRCTEPRKAGI